MKPIFAVLSFLGGAAVGSAVTFFLLKDKMEKQYEQETKETRDALQKKVEELNSVIDGLKNPDKKKKEEEPKKVKVVNSFQQKASNISKEEGYYNYSSGDPGPEPVPYFGDPKAKPVIIPPEEFGDDEDYEKTTFFYYTDGAICDENDEPVEDIAGSIGEDAKDHFGEYEDDAVYIRNDRLKVYYELLMSLKSYSEDVLPNKPFLHPSGDVLD